MGGGGEGGGWEAGREHGLVVEFEASGEGLVQGPSPCPSKCPAYSQVPEGVTTGEVQTTQWKPNTEGLGFNPDIDPDML